MVQDSYCNSRYHILLWQLSNHKRSEERNRELLLVQLSSFLFLIRGETLFCVCPLLPLLLSLFSRVRLCETLWTAAHQAPLSIGFSRQEYWSGLPCPPPGDLPNQGSNPGLLHAGRFFTNWASREALCALSVQFSSVAQSCLTLLTPLTAAHQASLSITNSRSLLKLMSIESVMPSNHLILCPPLLLPPSTFPSSGSFPMSQFFTSGDQSIGVLASASVLPMNI